MLLLPALLLPLCPPQPQYSLAPSSFRHLSREGCPDFSSTYIHLSFVTATPAHPCPRLLAAFKVRLRDYTGLDRE